MLQININSPIPETNLQRPARQQLSKFYDGTLIFREFTENPDIKSLLFHQVEPAIRSYFGEVRALTTVSFGWPFLYHKLGVEKCHGVDLNKKQLTQFLERQIIPAGDARDGSVLSLFHRKYLDGDYQISLGNLIDYTDPKLESIVSSSNLVDLSNIPDYLSDEDTVDLAQFYFNNLPEGSSLVVTSSNFGNANIAKSALQNAGFVVEMKLAGKLATQNPVLYGKNELVNIYLLAQKPFPQEI